MNREELKNAGIDLHNLKGFIGKGEVMDADTGVPTAITAANVGVPAELLTYIDPKAIEVLTAPRNATKLFDEVVQGDWATERLKYRLSEKVGVIAPYGDFSEIGVSDVNNEWVPTDVYRFQTMIKYGDLETARNAQAKVSLVADKQRAAANTLAIYGNKYYMYGVPGLSIYGIVNHPDLPLALTPNTVGGATAWSAKDSVAIFGDIQKIVNDLIDKSQGLISATDKFKIGIAPALLGYMNTVNTYGKSALELVKLNYPNVEIVAIPEFHTAASGDYVFVIAEEVLGQKTGECVTPQKLRTFQVVPEASSFKQKAAAATCGFRLYMPFALSRMLVS